MWSWSIKTRKTSWKFRENDSKFSANDYYNAHCQNHSSITICTQQIYAHSRVAHKIVWSLEGTHRDTWKIFYYTQRSRRDTWEYVREKVLREFSACKSPTRSNHELTHVKCKIVRTCSKILEKSRRTFKLIKLLFQVYVLIYRLIH